MTEISERIGLGAGTARPIFSTSDEPEATGGGAERDDSIVAEHSVGKGQTAADG